MALNSNHTFLAVLAHLCPSPCANYRALRISRNTPISVSLRSNLKSLRLHLQGSNAKLALCENYPTLQQAYWQQPSSSQALRRHSRPQRQIHPQLHHQPARPLQRTLPRRPQSPRGPPQNLPRVPPAKHKILVPHKLLARRKHRLARPQNLPQALQPNITLQPLP